MSILSALLSPISNVITTYQKGKQEKRAAKAKVNEILTAAAAADSAVAGQIALVKVNNENSTWKDEFALITIAAPYWISFVIAFAAAIGWTDMDAALLIQDMFEPLAQVPEYWQETFKIGMLSALGVTVWNKIKPK